jgi:sec-independent protein translocase protein TatA
MPFKLGPLEIVLILVIILVVFGVGKLPQVGSALGKSIRAFKEGQGGEDEEETKKKPRRKQVKKVARKAAPASSQTSVSVANKTDNIARPEPLTTPSNN